MKKRRTAKQRAATKRMISANKRRKRKNPTYKCEGAKRRGCAGGATTVAKKTRRRKKSNPSRGSSSMTVPVFVANPRKRRRVKRKKNPTSRDGFKRRTRRRNPASGAVRAAELTALALLGGLVGLAVSKAIDSMGGGMSQTTVGALELVGGGLAGGLLAMSGSVPQAAGFGLAGALGFAGASKLYNGFVAPSPAATTTTPATQPAIPATTTARARMRPPMGVPPLPQMQQQRRAHPHLRAVSADLGAVEARLAGLGALEYGPVTYGAGR